MYVSIYLSFDLKTFENKSDTQEKYEILILTTFYHTINLTDKIFILALQPEFEHQSAVVTTAAVNNSHDFNLT